MVAVRGEDAKLTSPPKPHQGLFQLAVFQHAIRMLLLSLLKAVRDIRNPALHCNQEADRLHGCA